MIEIIKYERHLFAKNEADPLVGTLLVEVKGKMKLWFKVLRGKDNVYCVPPSLKLDDKWLPAFELSDPAAHKKLCNDVLQRLLDSGRMD